MSLTFAARYPDLWKAVVDMFGPYNLLTFIKHISETWKPYMNIALGKPEIPEEIQFLQKLSPQTFIINIKVYRPNV